MKNKFLIFTVTLFLILFTWSCKKAAVTDKDNNSTDTGIGQKIGNTIKNFQEKDQYGKDFSLDSYKGKVILLNISAMWCSPCRSEASELMELYNTYKERGFEIVQCIYQDENGERSDQSDIKRWADEFNISYTVINDPDGSLTGFFTFSGIPFNLIIGRDFTIQYRLEGFYKEDIINKIEELL